MIRYIKSNEDPKFTGDSERPRRTGLVEEGLVVKTTDRRLTINNKWAAVWKITQKGKDELRRNA